MEIVDCLDLTPDDPYSIKIDGPAEAAALTKDSTVLYIGNNGVDRDARAHKLEREPEDRQRRRVEMERRERGLTRRQVVDTRPRVRSTRRRVLNTYRRVMIRRSDHWWQVKAETARNPERRLVCNPDILKARDLKLKKPKPKIPRKTLNPD
jgi:hypothetical protein